jgi:hypothetical protein
MHDDLKGIRKDYETLSFGFDTPGGIGDGY